MEIGKKQLGHPKSLMTPDLDRTYNCGADSREAVIRTRKSMTPLQFTVRGKSFPMTTRTYTSRPYPAPPMQYVLIYKVSTVSPVS